MLNIRPFKQLRINQLRTPVAMVAAVLLFTACDSGEQKTTEAQTQTAPAQVPANILDPATRARYEAVEQLSAETHQAAVQSAEMLSTCLDALMKQPESSRLEECRNRWQMAHKHFQSLMVFYQLNRARALLQKKLPERSYSLASAIDQADMLPGYLDTVEGYPASGLIHATELALNAQLLEEKQHFTDPLFLTFGFHPLEFMLWSKSGLTADLYNAGNNEGNKDSGDALEGNVLAETPDMNENTRPDAGDAIPAVTRDDIMQRRLQLTSLIGQALLTDLKLMASEWETRNLSAEMVNKDEVTSENYPLLESAMRFIESAFSDALKPLTDEPGWHYQQHMIYSEDASSFWVGRIAGLKKLLPLLNSSVETDAKLQELGNCLVELAPTATDQQAQMNDCQTTIRSLQESVILDVSEKL